MLERDYENQFGTGAVLSGSDVVSQELMTARWQSIQEKYVALGGNKLNILLHNLQMPLIFRSRGGIGTHWMMPRWVTLRDPYALQLAEAASVQVTADIATRLIAELAASGDPTGAFRDIADGAAVGREQAAMVRDWIDRDPFAQNWRSLAQALGKNAD